MAGEWREKPLSELCSYINRGAAPAYIEAGGILVLNQKCVRDQRVSFAEARRSDPVRKPVTPERMLQPLDILVNSTGVGTLGRVAQLSALPEPAMVDSHVTLVRPDPEAANPRYLGYAIRNFEQEIEALGEGSTGQTELARSRLAAFTVPVPQLSTQRAIAHILGTLDDRIELNRRMSETLEAMARALFQSWFVDFLPVRAKMAAKEDDPSLLLPQAEQGTWYVYAIECNDGSLYIGQTEDLRQRWLQHIGGKGSDWTKRHPPVRVPYWEKQPSRETAVERERWLKTGFGRKWLKKEIAARTQTGDPVRAKLDGRWRKGQTLPGLPAHLYDLFPARLVDSELGEIPEGWEVGRIRDCCTQIQNGGTPSRRELRFWEGGAIPWLTSAEVRQPIITTTENFITEAGLNESSAKWVAPLSTVVALYGATAGQVALVSARLTTNQAVCALAPRKHFEFFKELV